VCILESSGVTRCLQELKRFVSEVSRQLCCRAVQGAVFEGAGGDGVEVVLERTKKVWGCVPWPILHFSSFLHFDPFACFASTPSLPHHLPPLFSFLECYGRPASSPSSLVSCASSPLRSEPMAHSTPASSPATTAPSPYYPTPQPEDF
jgi:hypothetical protein